MTDILWRDDLLELVEGELRLSLPHVVPEHFLQPLDVFPGQGPVLPNNNNNYNKQYNVHISHLVGDADNEGHDLLHGVDCIVVLVNAGQELGQNSPAVPDLIEPIGRNVVIFA